MDSPDQGNSKAKTIGTPIAAAEKPFPQIRQTDFSS
jgi:hypothetical protein